MPRQGKARVLSEAEFNRAIAVQKAARHGLRNVALRLAVNGILCSTIRINFFANEKCVRHSNFVLEQLPRVGDCCLQVVALKNLFGLERCSLKLLERLLVYIEFEHLGIASEKGL